MRAGYNNKKCMAENQTEKEKQLEKDNKSLQTKVTDLEKANAALTEDVKKKDAAIADLTSVNEELTVQLEKKEAQTNLAPVEKNVFEHAGISYKITVPKFRIGNDIITADQVMKDQNLQKKLVRIQAGVISEIPTESAAEEED